MDPGRKEHIGGPPQVGACGAIRARGKEVRLLERWIMAGSIREPADQIFGSVVTGRDVAAAYTSPGVQTIPVRDSVAEGDRKGRLDG